MTQGALSKGLYSDHFLPSWTSSAELAAPQKQSCYFQIHLTCVYFQVQFSIDQSASTAQRLWQTAIPNNMQPRPLWLRAYSHPREAVGMDEKGRRPSQLQQRLRILKDSMIDENGVATPPQWPRPYSKPLQPQK